MRSSCYVILGPALHRSSQTIIVLMAALLFSLGLVEVVLRFFVPQTLTPLLAGFDPPDLYRSDPQHGWVLEPYFQGQFVNQTLVQINSMGLRDEEYAPKQSDEIRLLVQGDSYTFGFGVELEQSYSKVLERFLQQRFPQVRMAVINAGVVGYNTHHMLMTFPHLYAALQPDMVLATFIAANDVYENVVFSQQLQTALKTPPGFWGHHSHAVRLLQRALWPGQFFVANRHPRHVAYTLQLLEQLRQTYARVQLPYVLLIIPARHRVEPEVHGMAKLLTAVRGEAILVWHNRRVSACCPAQQFPCLDLSPSLIAQASRRPCILWMILTPMLWGTK